MSIFQNLSSCIVLDGEESSADETPAISTVTSAAATKTKSDLATFPPVSDLNLTPQASTDNYSHSFSGSGICNPGFNFEDDENEKDDTEQEHDEGSNVRGESLVSDSGHQPTTDNSKTTENVAIPKSKKSEKSKHKTKSVSQAENENDTDEDAASISTTVSEASTVVPSGDSYQIVDRPVPPPVPEKKRKTQPSSNGSLVSQSQQPMRRKASVRSQPRLASGEGNVKIVEIKSRDVVQGILRMEPQLSGLGRNHVSIVKVPVTSQTLNTMQPSVNANNARQPASSNYAGSGPSQESKDGNVVQKVRMLLEINFF